MDELFLSGFGTMIHNHLENNREITTKTGLIRSLRSFYQTNEGAIKAGYQVHDTIPTSFIITAQLEDLEYRLLQTRFIDIENGYCSKEKLPAKHCEKNMWLIKPAALNQGRGIEICRTLKEITTSLRTKPMHSVWLVQKYVEKPLLFKSRKFDIRIWAVATGKHDFFYYKHGYLRTSSSEYDPQGLDNFIHLTNNCLQKHGENYGAHEKGNTLSFQSFQEYLDQEFPKFHINFWTHLLPRMKDLMIDSYISAKKIMHKGKRNKVFELFGYDFLIDEDFRVWLLEVNTNPYLGVPNDYIEKLLPVLLDDLLALCLDVHLPPKNPRARTENDFELLYCEVASIYSCDGTSKNLRQSYAAGLYPVPELAQTPMCRYKPEGEVHSLPPDNSRPVVRDILQTVKEELETTVAQDISDFANICARVMNHLNNWELMSEEQNNSAIQALQILAGSSGASAFAVYNHMANILDLCSSENIPGYMQIGALEGVAIGCYDTKFRKEVVSLGICESLINYLLSAESEENLRMKALKVLIVISTHPTKNVYIPGKTREDNWVRSKIIGEGVLMCFYKLAQNGDGCIQEQIKEHLKEEYGTSDWELQLTLLERILAGSGSSLPKVHRTNSMKINSEANSSLMKDPKLQRLPNILNDQDFLIRAKREIRQFCEEKREETKMKIEKGKQKKIENNEEKQRLEEEMERVCEEKRQKALEYVNKRYEEIRKEKLEELKRRKDSHTQEDKFDENKKAQLIEKLRKTEEIKRIQRMKIKKQEEDIKKLEETKKKEIEEKRKKVMEEWLYNKAEKEKEKKMFEQQKREEDQLRRNIEATLRKEELLQRIEEKKSKMKKMKEEKKEKVRKYDNQLAEESSRMMLENEDLMKNIFLNNTAINPQVHPRFKEIKSKKIKMFEKKKKKLSSVPANFLYEIYGSHPGKSRIMHYKYTQYRDYM